MTNEIKTAIIDCLRENNFPRAVLNMTEEALNKQIVMDTIIRKSNYFVTGEFEHAECPACGADLRLNDNFGDNYCCECGQRLI